MFFIYSLIISLFMLVLFPRLKKETSVISFIVLAILSPGLFLMNKYFEHSYEISFLKTDISLQIFFILFLFSTAIYWLTKLVKEEREEFPFLKNEGVTLLLVVTNLSILKVLLLTVYSTIKGLNFEDKIEVKTKYIIITILALMTFLNIESLNQVVVIIYIILLAKFYTEKINDNDHYLLFVITSLLRERNIIGAEITLVILILLLISYFRFKLSEKDLQMLRQKIKLLKPFQILEKVIDKGPYSELKINYLKQEKLIEKKAPSITFLSIKQNEYMLSILISIIMFLSLVLFVFEGIWLQG